MSTLIEGENEVVSVSVAKRQLSRILLNVREGRSYVVTDQGRSIAVIVPPETCDRISAGMYAALIERLSTQEVNAAGRSNRDELYQDDDQ